MISMKKLLSASLFFSLFLILNSCENRNTACECLDVKNRIGDVFTKSKKEQDEFQKGCEWMEEEMSAQEMAEKLVECNLNKDKEE